MSPLMSRALDPFIQVLKPISPLAWMPLALYTIKDSSLSSIFVIFICSLWPMLINTAFGVAAVRKEWLNVARTLEVGTLRRAFTIILPAAAPTILTGMRISIGIAWLVIVAAEMLVGGTGIGYFVWNEWNNLSHHQRDHRDPGDRRRRHGARPDSSRAHAARDVPGVRLVSLQHLRCHPGTGDPPASQDSQG
jgi:ABC-type nitrate/sulfonate/bicarbonate transport system permease component